MRILYGVVGEGMGHATRSRVVLDHLATQGHAIRVVVSGRAFGFLTQALALHDNVDVIEISGLRLVQERGAVNKSASVRANVADAPWSIARNVEAFAEVAASFSAQAVISDFESWAYLYGRTYDIPVISLDNIQILNRCRLDEVIDTWGSLSFQVAKLSAKLKLPHAYHYLITSFFRPPVRKERTNLVPPILRPEILQAVREPGEHVLVYQGAEALNALLPALRRRSDVVFRVYGANREDTEGHLQFRPFSQHGFVDDLRTARAVIAGGGFSLMSEAVHLGVPMLCVPLEAQAEQAVNAAYLDALGYGMAVKALTGDVIDRFLAEVPALTQSLAGFERHDNQMTLDCVDELLARIDAGEAAVDVLSTATLGDCVDTAIDRVVPPE